MQKKKLFILIKNLDGGTGTFLSLILNLDGFDIKVCALGRPKFGQINSADSFYFSNKPSHLGYFGFNPISYMRIIGEFFWLKKLTESYRPDVILSVDLHCNLLLGLVKRFSGVDFKIILTTHNNLSALLKSVVLEGKIPFFLVPVLKFATKVIFRGADSLVCISKGVGDDIRRNFGQKGKVEVIPYGINANNVRRLSKKVMVKKDAIRFKGFNIISIGRFEKQKDFFTLIRAFDLVRKSVAYSNLILLGEGSQKKELMKLVDDLNLGNCVHFLGWQKNVYPYLAKSDLFVLSSNFEGLGYVILEAMACGVPVLATNANWGPSEVLEEGKYGAVVPVGNAEKMAKEIVKLIKNQNLRKSLSQKGLLRVESYTEESMVKSYKRLLAGL